MRSTEGEDRGDAASTFTSSTNPRASQVPDATAPHPNFILRIYRWLHSFSSATRCLIFIVPFLLLMTIPIIINLVWFPNRAFIAGTEMYYWAIYLMVVWTALFGSRVVISYLPNVIQWVFGVMTISIKRYMDYIRHTEKYLGHVLSSLIAFVTFPAIMVLNTQNGKTNPLSPLSWQSTIQSLLLVLLILSACIAGEKFFLQIVAVRFHERTFRDRIVESSFAAIVISKLDQAAKHRHTQSIRQDSVGDTESDDHPKLLRPATDLLKKNFARLVEHTRNALEVTTNTIGHIASEITGKDLRADKDDSFNVIQTPSEARRLGRRVFKMLCPHTRDHLLLEDFIPLFDDSTEAEKAFWIFDRDGNGDISLDEFVSGCSHAFRERRAIMQSLRDLDQAIGKLDSILKTAIYVIILLIVIAIFLGDFTTYIATAGSLFLALSFMIGSTAQAVFESIIFVFVRHPFDVGDRVIIDDFSYVVKEMHLLTTTLESDDGGEIYAPNNLLSGGMIQNLRRSGPMSEKVQIQVAFDTDFKQIEALHEYLLEFLKSEARDYMPRLEVMVIDIKECNKMVLEVEIQYKVNLQDDGRRAMRKNKFMIQLKEAIEELGITYRPHIKRYERIGSSGSDGESPSHRSSSASVPRLARPGLARAASNSSASRLRLVPNSSTSRLDATLGVRSDEELEDMEEEEEERRRNRTQGIVTFASEKVEVEAEEEQWLEAGLGRSPSSSLALPPPVFSIEEVELQEIAE